MLLATSCAAMAEPSLRPRTSTAMSFQSAPWLSWTCRMDATTAASWSSQKLTRTQPSWSSCFFTSCTTSA